MAGTLPATTRIFIIRTTLPIATRKFHMSCRRTIDSKASFATIAPEKPTAPTSTVPSTPQPEGKAVATVDAKSLAHNVDDKRDFHWHHPVYTREEYEAIQVPSFFLSI
jgi:hypothetical protein